MTDPYEPPSSVEEQESVDGHRESLFGFVIGGFGIPISLFLLCSAFLDDTGSPLIWVFMGVVLGVVGFFIGLGIRSVK